MFIDLDNPVSVIGFGRIEQSTGFWHDIWKNNDFLMIYLAEGDLEFEFENQQYKMLAGDTLIIPKGSNNRPLASNGCVYYYFNFSVTETEPAISQYKITASHSHALSNFAYSFNNAERAVIEVKTLTRHTGDSRLDKIMNRCAELDMWQRPNEKLLLDNYMREILIQLSLMQEASSEVDQVFNRMKLFIEGNYRRNISLGDVAEKVHISPSYAAKLFRKNTGMRCCDYINKVRLDAACEVLVNTHLRISDIAEQVGYSSQYYFARQFKKVYGMTAGQFRKGAQKKES